MSEASSATAAHLEAVRRRGRHLMARETETDLPTEVFHAASAARDGLILMLSLWLVLTGLGHPEWVQVVFAATICFALYTGVANALAVSAQVRFWQSELRRERAEIRREPEREREEVRALYEAKGFTGAVLDEIVGTLCADEDRLLKVMMEEELGIFFEQANHPVVMGLITGAASLIGGLSVGAAAAFGGTQAAIAAAVVLLAAISVVRTGGGLRSTVQSFARWGITAGAVGGVAYHVAELFAGLR